MKARQLIKLLKQLLPGDKYVFTETGWDNLVSGFVVDSSIRAVFIQPKNLEDYSLKRFLQEVKKIKAALDGRSSYNNEVIQ